MLATLDRLSTTTDPYAALAAAAARAAEKDKGNIPWPTVEQGYSPLCIKIVEGAVDSALGGVFVRDYRLDPGETIWVDRMDVFVGAASFLSDEYGAEEMFNAIRQALRYLEFEEHDEPEGDATVIEVRKNKLGWGGVAKHTTRPYAALLRGEFLVDTAGRTRTFATRAAAERAAGLALAWSHGKSAS